MSSAQDVRDNNGENRYQPKNNTRPYFIVQEHNMDDKNNNLNDGTDEKGKLKVNLENAIPDMSEPDKIIYMVKDILNRRI